MQRYQGNIVGLVSYKTPQTEVESQRYFAIAANDLYSAYEEFLRNNQSAEAISILTNNITTETKDNSSNKNVDIKLNVLSEVLSSLSPSFF